MYHAGNLSLVLCLYGDTVATVSHGNHCVLQVGSGTAAYIGRKLAVDFIIGIFHGSAHLFQSCTGVVSNFFF